MKRKILLALIAATFFGPSCADTTTQPDYIHSTGFGERLDADIRAEKFKQITSVVISQGGETVFEHYWGEGNPAHLNDTRSAMKTLIGMAVGAAIADGKISNVNESVFKHFEKERPFRFTSKRKDEITLRDLLTMTSALDCYDDDWDSPGNEEHMHPARNWTYFVTDLPTREDYQRGETGLGPMYYCTAGSFFLGQIVERAVGEPIDDYIGRRLLEPLGITEIKWDRSPSGEVMTGGGAELNSRDLLKLGVLLLNDGTYKGEVLLPKTWTQTMMDKHVKANDRQHYGYQIWHEDFTCGDGTVSAWYMGGNGGNKIVIVDELDLTAVITATLYGTRGMHQQSTDIMQDYILASQPQCLK